MHVASSMMNMVTWIIFVAMSLLCSDSAAESPAVIMASVSGTADITFATGRADYDFTEEETETEETEMRRSAEKTLGSGAVGAKNDLDTSSGWSPIWPEVELSPEKPGDRRRRRRRRRRRIGRRRDDRRRGIGR